MFKSVHHQRILLILQKLDADLLRRCRAYFGGGTLLALEGREYRESRDIDFICPFGTGYRELRQAVAQQEYQALFPDRDRLTFPRELQANQYGVRCLVEIESVPIKFEIVAEGRIDLDKPVQPDWSPVACLNQVDRIAEKLLANADRWNDDSVESRDLIDLAMLRLGGRWPSAAIAKAETAYPVQDALIKAIQRFQAKPDYRDRCYQSLQIRQPAQVMDGLDLLAIAFGLDKSDRTFQEQSEKSE
jgi:hypothetical protein